VRPTIVLRADYHLQQKQPDMTRTDSDRYHGGTFPEELAALTSLAVGIRLRAGHSTRWFQQGDDPKGHPYEFSPQPVSRTFLRVEERGWILPTVAEGDHPLGFLQVLESFPMLSVSSANAVIRAARLYQDALWLAESQPALAWLMLVSAIEAAANEWRTNQDNAVDRLKEARPDFIGYLETLGESVVERVATEFADSLGSTKKFVDFVFEFLPGPPAGRPPEWACCAWDQARLRKILRKIYDYRSKALHEGRPFPAPMSEIPYSAKGWVAPAEKPMGMASSTQGGVWLAEDTPILLHTFEYITRSVLLSWWGRLGATN
jgi:hypothetical protein